MIPVSPDIQLPKPRTVKISDRRRMTNLFELDSKGLLYKQRKRDGARAFYLNGEIWSRSRTVTGDRICYSSKVQGVIGDLLCTGIPSGTILDGELVVRDSNDRDKPRVVTGILNAGPDRAIELQEEHGVVEFFIFDLLSLEGEWITHLTYRDRMSILSRRFKRAIYRWPLLRIMKSYWLPLHQLLGLANRRKWEGIVVKHVGHQTQVRGVGEPTPRIDGCYKLKFRSTWDFAVTGIGEGAKGKKHLKLAVFKDGRLVPAGKVSNLAGTTVAEIERLSFPFVVEVEADELSEKGIPQKPAFVRIRNDKIPEECVIEGSAQ